MRELVLRRPPVPGNLRRVSRRTCGAIYLMQISKLYALYWSGPDVSIVRAGFCGAGGLVHFGADECCPSICPLRGLLRANGSFKGKT